MSASGAASTLPAGLEQAFLLAAGELGMCTSAWLFCDEVEAHGGPPALEALREALGARFPVLDAVVGARLEGLAGPTVDVERVLGALEGARRVVLVGVEALFLDALVARLSGVELFLLQHSVFQPDWPRVLANFGGRVRGVALGDFQRHAGASSALVTFVYGASSGAGEGAPSATCHVLPAWVRVSGDDVRTQFRSLVGWDVLRRPYFVYPRWLVEVSAETFTEVITS